MSESQNLPNLAIGFSRARLLTLFGGSLLLTLLCAALAFSWQEGSDVTKFLVAICYVGAVFFGLATCRMLWRLATARQPVVFATCKQYWGAGRPVQAEAEAEAQAEPVS